MSESTESRNERRLQVLLDGLHSELPKRVAGGPPVERETLRLRFQNELDPERTRIVDEWIMTYRDWSDAIAEIAVEEYHASADVDRE